MAQSTWTVYAYSPSLNQRVRRFDLANMQTQITEQQARQDAQYFAQLQNTNQFMNTQDWQALVELEQLGIDTLPGYIGSV
jgi:hypothetical protein